ncbi:MAG TPA: radical SAM protein [Candidatus Omnitrophota bacterium]|nr:radical SAM protein [Candidatus Omnitrophota bacterium]
MDRNKFWYLVQNNSIDFRRFIPTLFDNIRVLLTNAHPDRGPLFAVWSVTSLCNLKCVFCDRWKGGGEGLGREGGELGPAEKAEIVKRLAHAGVWFLSFCGGEPLICKDLEGLVRSAKSYGMAVNISTNGLLLKERARSLIEAGADFITISVDSDTAEEHDRARGYSGLFKKITEGIDEIRSCRKNTYIEIRCLVSGTNYMCLDGIAKTFADKADCVSFKPIYENAGARYKVPEDMAVKPENSESLRSYFSMLLEQNRRLDNIYHRYMPDFLLGEDPPEKHRRCYAGTFFAGIDHLGHLSPCQEMELTEETTNRNIINSDFIDIWRGDTFTKTRTIFKESVPCKCWMDRMRLNMDMAAAMAPVEKFFGIRHDKKKAPPVL